MDYRLFGAMLIILGCGGFGFSLAATHRREETYLRKLIGALDYMECELQFRLTPLPELCRNAGKECEGPVGTLLLDLAGELECQTLPDASTCMCAVLSRNEGLPYHTAQNLRLLGNSLGRFDITGQLSGLEAVRSSCRRALDALSIDRDSRLRSYQTLGLCTGAALAILLI